MSEPLVTARDVFGPSANDERFTRIGEGHYVLSAPDTLNTDLEIDHVRRERHQLYGELTVRTGLPGVSTVYGTLFTATINLSSLRDRHSVALALSSRTRTKEDAPWRALVDELAIHVSAAERDGDPAVLLRDVPKRTGSDRWLRAHGFTLPEKLPAMLFGDGDTLKTYTADAIAVELARQGIPTGIVDAEMTADDHQPRAEHLSGGMIPDGLAYLSCSRPLIHERDRVAEMVRTHSLRYLIFDSVAFLCHDKPEAADAAMQYFRACRSLGPIGSLHLAHTTKGEQGDQKPFGSTFWFNSVRALWYTKRADTAAGSTIAEIGYYPRKFNVGARPGAHALRFTFEPGRTRVEPIEAASVEELAAGMPIKERVRAVLKSGARTLADLSNELPDVETENLNRVVRRYASDKAKFKLFAKLPDGRFGLVEGRTS